MFVFQNHINTIMKIKCIIYGMIIKIKEILFLNKTVWFMPDFFKTIWILGKNNFEYYRCLLLGNI